MENFEKEYLTLMNHIYYQGIDRPDERTGVGCKSVFAPSLEFDLRSGYFPQITCRFISAKVHEAEFQWFTTGHTNIKYLQNRGIKIWDYWADANGDLGPTYGHQLVNFASAGYNQFEAVVKSIKEQPDHRRHIISLWAPHQLKDMALPPCWLMFQFYVEKDTLHLLAIQRSVDLVLGFPYDMCIFARLLLCIAELTNLKPGLIKVQMGDAHIYNNHMEIAQELIWSDKRFLPKYTYENGKLTLHNYTYKSKIEIPVNV